MTMGLPLEAPKEATRGWDIPTLRAGLQGLAPQHAPKLGLFCRCACMCMHLTVNSQGLTPKVASQLKV